MNNELQEMFDEIRELHHQYQNAIEGRKEIAKEIKEKIKIIKSKTMMFNSELHELQDYYEFRDYYVSDYEEVMRLILRLANREEDNYEMKEIYSVDFIHTENNEDVRRICGRTLVIGDSEAIKEVKDQKEYYYDEIKELSTRIINKGNSMVMVTYNALESNVKPRIDKLHRINIVDIKNGGIIGNISCYLHDDNLKKAVKMITRYIYINGPDFRNIDEDTLYELIVKCNNKAKIKQKNRILLIKK